MIDNLYETLIRQNENDKYIPVTTNRNLVNYSIFNDKVNSLYKKNIIEHYTKESQTINRAVGSIMGMAIGDAFGAPLEFVPVSSQANPRFCLYYNGEFKYSGIFNKFTLKSGQWTDDCSMGLCIADSLLIHKKYDGSDIRHRFWNWWYNGYNNAFRFDANSSKHSVGLGGNIKKSLDAMRRNETATPIFNTDNEDAGNGSIMRLCPIPIAFRNDINKCIMYAEQSSKTTHGGKLAAECCKLMSFIIVKAITRKTDGLIKQFLDETLSEYIRINKNIDKSILKLIHANELYNSTELCWNWRNKYLDFETTLKNRGHNYNGYPVSSPYFGSFCIDALAMAFNALYNTTNFNDAIIKVVNMLGDADSTGSVTGQIAGAFYGYNNIHKDFISNVNNWDNYEIQLRGVLLCLTNIK